MMERSSRHAWLVAVVLLAAGLTGCAGSKSATEPPPDERFGYRYEDGAPDGRTTVTIAPPDSSQQYFYYPAPIDTVHVRPAAFDASVPADSQTVEVEVLVKGAFPDGCSELHDVRQQRAGNIIEMTLEMRKPQGAICANVRRPYRFYVMLTGAYGVGHYTLRVNDSERNVYPFQIRAPQTETR